MKREYNVEQYEAHIVDNMIRSKLAQRGEHETSREFSFNEEGNFVIKVHSKSMLAAGGQSYFELTLSKKECDG